MDRILIRYLTNYNNENVTHSIIRIRQMKPQKLPIIFEILPNCHIFAKSGHAD